MSSGFRRGAGGCVLVSFSPVEAMLLHSLAAQLVELLADDQPSAARSTDPLASLLDFQGPVDPPADPVLARLLPDAYRDDEEAAADFRRYTEQGLREGKVGNAREVLDTLAAGGLADVQEAGSGEPSSDDDVEAVLDADAANAWLRSLTDLRLALATRLGIDEDDDDRWERLPDDDPRLAMYDVYGWLGFLQETLVRALTGRAR